MKGIALVVAALLLTTLAGNAAAADSGQKGKKAQKILATLNMLGIDNKEVKEFISQANENIHDGYYHLSQRKMAGGQLTLRYELSSGAPGRQVELHFAPKDSHLEGLARTDRVLVRYRLQF